MSALCQRFRALKALQGFSRKQDLEGYTIQPPVAVVKLGGLESSIRSSNGSHLLLPSQEVRTRSPKVIGEGTWVEAGDEESLSRHGHAKMDFASKVREATTTSTDVQLIHAGRVGSPEWEEARRWFEKAWGDCCEELKSRINKPGL